MFSGQLEPAEALFSSFIYQYHKTQHFAQNSSLFKMPLVKGRAQHLDHVGLVKTTVFYFSLALFISCLSAFHVGVMGERVYF